MPLKKLLADIRNNALILPLYLPALLTAFVEGISNPTLPLYARELGAAYAAVGLILAGRPSLGAALFIIVENTTCSDGCCIGFM